MKITFAQKDLQMAAQVMQTIVNPTTSLNILRNVLVDVGPDGKATFLASDLEAYAKVTIDSKSDDKGRVTLPAKTFADIVKELPDADVSLATKGSKAEIKCEEIDYQLATMPPDDFPDWPEFQPVTSLTISQDVLRKALDKVACAIPTRDPRKVLLGAYFDLKEDGLRIVSTDGKKLVLVRVPVEEVEGATEHSAIVPGKIVGEISRQLGESGVVKLQFGERQAAFDTGSVFYASNVIEGEFPRYEMVVPSEFEREAKVSRETLISGIRRASIVQDKNEYGVSLKFAEGGLTISARGHELGTFEGHVPAEYSGDEYSIVFNYAFLLDLLKVAAGGEATLKMNSPSTPAIFHIDGDEDSTFLLMPIKAAEYEDSDDDANEEEDEYDDEDYE